MLFKWFDKLTENTTRQSARLTSRRSFLASVGTVLVGTAAYPLLPVWRNGAQAASQAGADPKEVSPGQDPGDPESCEYWRYCAIDGYLCSCCGGTKTSCPPGTQMAPITWIGTCRNPADGKDYIISYNDCCGKSACGRCQCIRNENDTPAYLPANSNNINWCSGGPADVVYNCSTAIILGIQ
ncbi:methylamine dehydrogenase (amicyanin) light chain [Pseudomaricurvus alkylphenolicus]|uniref:methylamine dehydrogenase light chain n=1 Tax=Pseudomaricurvus alkylphenolicus TaxID=1306991 RepID=UPI001422D391|nr:methylamine dehydrogenase light chain [Pseudomaricurvus alkylphenolicus]NIB44707.1 methylamine dehydrogenase (amicyanin) light chain [Pseudomaricurvus alkylphenolicus]